MSYSGDLVLPDDFDLEQELLEVAKKQMAALGERMGVGAENRHIELGTTGRTILRFASDLDVDLIILGSHGRHGLAVLLGSTARSVLNGASCDVLGGAYQGERLEFAWMVRASGICSVPATPRIRRSVQMAFVVPGVASLHQGQGGVMLGQIPAVAFEKEDVRRKYPVEGCLAARGSDRIFESRLY